MRFRNVPASLWQNVEQYASHDTHTFEVSSLYLSSRPEMQFQ